MNDPQTTDARALQQRLQATIEGPALIGCEPGELETALHGQWFGQQSGASPLARTLIAFLNAKRWAGSARELAEALPHYVTDIDEVGLASTLANLGFRTRTIAVAAGHFDPRFLPAILIRRDATPLLLLRVTDDGEFQVVDGTMGEMRQMGPDAIAGRLLVPLPKEGDARNGSVQPGSWMSRLLLRFRRQFVHMFLLGAVINLTGMVTPLFVMMIYDKVIPSRHAETLAFLAVGLGMFVCAELLLQLLRNRLVAYVGARLDYGTATAAFSQVLRMPPAATLSAPVSAQASRLREFDSLREVCTGTLASVAFDAPFLVVYLLMIWLLGGPMIYVGLSTLAAFGVCFALFRGPVRRTVARSSSLQAQRHAFMLEAFSKLRNIRRLALGETWTRRAQTLAADSSWGQFRLGQVNEYIQIASSFIVNTTVVLTITVGSMRVMDGAMSMGALVAVIGLTWRMLSPLQMAFLALNRLEQTATAVRRANQMMAMKVEPEPNACHHRATRTLRGAIAVERVYFRYPGAASDPALMGVSFNARPGEHICVYGESGSGKTTLLNLMMGLYEPQSGQVLFDGIDIRQANPAEFRRKIGFVGQTSHFFYGTIAQNLRMADVTASDEALVEACAALGIRERIEALPDGFNTRIGNQGTQRMGEGLLQSLAIARALVKRSPVLLLDEPGRALDQAGDQALMALLRNLHGRTTIVMCSQRPSHLRLADRLLVINKGQPVAFGTPSEILDNPVRERTA